MKFAKRLLMFAGAVSLAGLFSVMLAPKAVHAVVSTLVTVSNTTAQPVPTMAVDTRNVNVVNTPNVNVNSLPAVQLSGTPTVNATINGTPTVNVASPLSIGGNVNATVSNPAGTSGPIPLETAEVNNPAYQPASIEISLLSAASATATVPSTLPSGGTFRELVINWVTGICLNITSGVPVSTIALQTNGSQVSFFSSSSTDTTKSIPVTYFGTKTNLYASPGSTLNLVLLNGSNVGFAGESVSSTGATGTCLINADGYYVTQ
ncbi:MAG: hypothetical protein WA876_06955 [Candidatus Acidiferrales bacterium]